MGFGTLVYNVAAAGVNTVNLDFTAATDPDFTLRNGHYTFTESYRLLAASMIGASVIRGRFQVPTWNAIGEMAIFNANRSLQPPTNAQWDYWDAYPIPIPINEEFQVQVSNNLGASTEQESVVLQIITDDWNKNIPRGRLPILVRASFTLTPTLNGWSGGQTITLASSLRGGVYSIIGGVLQGTNALAWRVIFPRYKLYHGRKLRPGGLIQNAIGDFVSNQLDPYIFAWGEWGRFHTFELPTIDVFGTLAGSITYQLFLWCVYLGEDLALLNY